MTRSNLILIALLFLLISCQQQERKVSRPEYVLVIHGGAGAILKKDMTSELEKEYLDKLGEALETGADILKNGGTALDAVTETIQVMENSALFNAGKDPFLGT